MKKMLVISILGLMLAVNLMAQTPGDTLWTKTYGGAEEDLGRSVQQTTDGGFIIAGSTNSFGAGDEDLWVIKTDVNGDTLWTKTYGGIEEDQGNSIKQTSDGGYVVVGNTESYGAGDNDVYLIKINSDGDTLWTKTYGDINNESGIDIQLTSDGGYIILGSKSSVTPPTQWEIYVIKTDSNGDTLWTNTFGGTGLYWAAHIEQTLDGGYIISGSEDIYGGCPNIYVIKTDSIGNTQWTRIYGTHGVTMGEGYYIKPLTDGYILGGYIFDSQNPNLMAQANLIRIDSIGDTLWTKRYGGLGYEIFTSALKTNDGGFCLTGVSNSQTPGAAGPHDVYIVRTDSVGDTLWTRTYGGDNWEWAISMDLVQEGGYIVTGYTESFGAGDKDIWLLRIADEYIPLFNPPQNLFVTDEGYATWDEPSSPDLLGYKVYLDSVFVEYTTDLFYQYTELTNSQTYLAGVSALYDEGESDIIEFEFTYTGTNAGNEIVPTTKLIGNYPNPFNPETTISFSVTQTSSFVNIEVFNLKGQKVKTLINEKLEAGNHQVVWGGKDDNNKSVSSGIYFYKMNSGDYISIKKMILMK